MANKNANAKIPSENGGFEYMKPRQTTWQAFLTALWDPSTRQVFGRDGASWTKLLVFYTCFYIVLAALFAICMQGLLATIDEKQPTWQLDRSLIGTNPGLGFRPISENTDEGSLIWYNTKNESTIWKWMDLLDDFIEPYNNTKPGTNLVNCNFNKKPGPGETCVVDVKQFGPCSPEMSYGYKSASPCVFLKLNRIYGWIPEYYNSSTDLPEDMPDDLVEGIKNIESKRTQEQSTNQVWISCRGEGPADREHVNPEFGYYPTRGFPGYFYPYTNSEGYLSPLVAVQIINPTPNILVSIECRAWAKNILYHGGDQQREGSVHFEILKDV